MTVDTRRYCPYNVVMPFTNLNDMQVMFCYEYVTRLNLTQAAIAAGYAPDNAGQQGSQLYKHPQVRIAIDFLMAERMAAVKIDANWVLEEQKKLYENSNIDNFITIGEDGKPFYDFSTATREQLSALESLSIKPGEFGTQYKVNVAARKKILDQIGKHVDVQAWKDQLKTEETVTVIFSSEDEKV